MSNEAVKETLAKERGAKHPLPNVDQDQAADGLIGAELRGIGVAVRKLDLAQRERGVEDNEVVMNLTNCFISMKDCVMKMREEQLQIHDRIFKMRKEELPDAIHWRWIKVLNNDLAAFREEEKPLAEYEEMRGDEKARADEEELRMQNYSGKMMRATRSTLIGAMEARWAVLKRSRGRGRARSALQ
jgi:hypothetical protein